MMPPSFNTAGDLRRRAEDRLRARPGRETPAKTGATEQRIIQELQIHQIELELQNEELVSAKAEVDANLEKYTDLYEFAPIGYFSLDEQGQILEVNLTGAAMLEVERSHLTRRPFQFFLMPASRPEFPKFLEKVFAGYSRQSCEVLLAKANRTTLWVILEAKTAITVGSAQKFCRVAVIDITARKRADEAQRRNAALTATNFKLGVENARRRAAEARLRKSERHAHQLLDESRRLHAQLRSLARQMITVQEAERKRISRDLHDEISQLLVGINIHLEIFTSQAAAHPKKILQSTIRLRRLIARAVGMVHRYARELRPSTLDDFGLIPALKHFIEHFPRQPGRRIRLSAFAGVEALGEEIRTVLYRVVQEALANVAKHARASEVKVTIVKVAGGAVLTVADNGRAFDVGRLASSKGKQRLGLVGMRERVEMVGGRFAIESAPGKGTTVRAEFSIGIGKTASARRAPLSA
jgi:PAS domain S-box-containing protein